MAKVLADENWGQNVDVEAFLGAVMTATLEWGRVKVSKNRDLESAAARQGISP